VGASQTDLTTSDANPVTLEHTYAYVYVPHRRDPLKGRWVIQRTLLLADQLTALLSVGNYLGSDSKA
jgi:hypothetical protein